MTAQQCQCCGTLTYAANEHGECAACERRVRHNAKVFGIDLAYWSRTREVRLDKLT